MLNHLRLKHNTGIEHENTPQKQPSMAEFVRSPRSHHLSGTKAEEITRAIVNMVMPLRIVEGSGYKNLMSLIAPEYSVPSRNTIKARIDKVYDEEKSKLLENVLLKISSVVRVGTPLFGCTRLISAIGENLLDSWTYPYETSQSTSAFLCRQNYFP